MLGDIYNIRDRVKAIDNRFDIQYVGEGKYTVYQNGAFFMSVSELDDRVVKRIREVVWKNKHADILEEVENHNKKMEQVKEKDRQYLSQCIAEDLRKPLMDL